MIHLKHKDHGYKIAYSDIEAKDDKAHGWVEYDFNERVAKVAQPVEETEEKEPNGYLDKDEIKALLDELGIKYRKNASCDVLMELLEEHNGRADSN